MAKNRTRLRNTQWILTGVTFVFASVGILAATFDFFGILAATSDFFLRKNLNLFLKLNTGLFSLFGIHFCES